MRLVYILFINVYEFSRGSVGKNKRETSPRDASCVPAPLFSFFLVPLDFIFFEGSRLFNDDPWHAVAPGTSPSVEGAR